MVETRKFADFLLTDRHSKDLRICDLRAKEDLIPYLSSLQKNVYLLGF
jgi:hypothetical protein